MRAGPRPEMAVHLVAEPPASREFRIQQSLRDLLSFVARFGAGGISRDVARDLRDLSVVKGRATAPLVHAPQRGKHVGLREARAPHPAGDASQLGVPRAFGDRRAVSRSRFIPRLIAAGDELEPCVGQRRDRLFPGPPMFCPSVTPSARMQRRRRDRVTALGQQLHTGGEDLLLHLNARRQPKIVMPSVAGEARERPRQRAKTPLQLCARPIPAVARVDVDDDHAARRPRRDADVEVGRRPHKPLEGLEVVRRVVHAVLGQRILAGSIDAQLGWRERHDLEAQSVIKCFAQAVMSGAGRF